MQRWHHEFSSPLLQTSATKLLKLEPVQFGNFHGPGGSFKVDLMACDDLFSIFTTINTKRNKLRRIGKEGSWSSMKKVKKRMIELKGAPILCDLRLVSLKYNL
ncbi:hypothetical protein TIFTF001_044267 [Ficus carica]|uniref:Uncharacterized protein n=1 Tax=Ficus carica TaxID=3494 RepID=A0AA88D6N7_FICCA|nr:hypothetical protein TIFTF001_044266 [Ficus carica]GMN28732.1 hypothetical protein TIFTF001_044267 [Ficus carica]